MSELSMRFLGGADLEIDGRPIQLRRRRSLALLAYLVLTGRPQTRDSLAAFLSGDVGESQARKLLRNALTDLGEHGINDFLLIDRQLIAFDTTRPYHLDIATLDGLLDTTATPDPTTSERAVALWNQELLSGLVLREAPLFESWLEQQREHLAGRLTRIVNRLLEYHLRTDEPGPGIALARRVLTVRAWHEETHRVLMRLLARDGQREAALAQYENCRRALADELGVAPQPETAALAERLRAGPFVPRHNFVPPAADMVGRAPELAEIGHLLALPDCRLLTLVGLGGIGKTRLALAAAARFTAPVLLADDHAYPDGVFLADLATLAGAGAGGAAERRLVMALGLALGLAFYGNVDRLAQLVAYLRPKRLLLVLDNLERLRPGAGALQEILREAPGVTVLATSRVRLGLPEEHVRELAGLGLPAGAEALEQAPAAQLFLHEAQRLNVRLTTNDRSHVARICELTDGLPLALLIASGWLRVLSCAEIARELEAGGGLLGASPRRRPAGQESLRAILAYAWRDLSRQERRALRLLAAFPGHFDRAAAEAIGVALPALLALCDKSLVDRDGDDGYRLHHLVRQYSAEQLGRHPVEEAQVRARHAAYYAVSLARWMEDLSRRSEAHAQIGADRANLLAAWSWAVAHLDLGLVARLRDGLATWFQMAGLHHEWAEVLDEAVGRHRAALAEQVDPALQVSLGWLLAAEASAWMWQGSLDRAYPLLAEARQCARAVGMIPLEVRVSLYEGRLSHYQGESRAASALLTQALILSRVIPERGLEAESLLSLGLAAADMGDFAEAEVQLHQAEQLYRTLGDRLALGRLAVQRTRLYIARAEYIKAEVDLGQSLQVVRSYRNRREEGWACAYLGLVCDLGMGRHREADEAHDRAHAIAEESGDLRFWAFVRWAQGLNALHIGAFARANGSFGQALDYGRAAGSPVAIGHALYGQGLLAYARGDEGTADDLARQALRIAEDTERRPELASSLLLLGQVQGYLGLTTVATETFARALTLARELPMPAVACEAATGLASVALAAGEVEHAAEHAAAIVPYLQEHNLAGCNEPGRVILTCYRALHAVRDPRAREVLEFGAVLLQQRAAALPDEYRALYLGMFPERRDVLDSWREYEATTGSRPAPPISLFPVTGHRIPRQHRSRGEAKQGSSQAPAR